MGVHEKMPPPGATLRVDLKNIILSMAKVRPIFTSEKDFQFALAWRLKEEGCDLRLEYDPGCLKRNAAVDIWVIEPETIAIELKHSTVAFNHNGIFLRSHPGDVARYGTVCDVRRLETITAALPANRGLSVLMTNNWTLWTKNNAKKRNCDQFAIHNGAVLSGSMKWLEKASPNTFKAYPVPVALQHRYECTWFDYVNLKKPNGLFRCLITEISSPQSIGAAAATPLSNQRGALPRCGGGGPRR